MKKIARHSIFTRKNYAENSSLRQLVGLVLLPAFLGFFVMNTAFLHVHKLPDGRMIIHSHAIPQAPPLELGGENHRHTKFDYFINLMMSKFILVFLLIGVLGDPLLTKSLFRDISRFVYPVSVIIRLFALRAPPFSIH